MPPKSTRVRCYIPHNITQINILLYYLNFDLAKPPKEYDAY